MEITSNSTVTISLPLSQSFFVAVTVTALCFFVALFTFLRPSPFSSSLNKLRSSISSGSSSSILPNGKAPTNCSVCSCSCHDSICNNRNLESASNASASYLNSDTGSFVPEMLETETAPSLVLSEPSLVLSERQTGASMMEQLVPEITTHALSYLDYPSLCRLSMTNSLMRKAANDDNAWKALYHKDFSLEQDSVTPINGWKAYYAATRAVVNINTEFFNILRERSIQSMSHFWLNGDYVKCVHASGEHFSGYDAVMQSWQIVFSWEQGMNFQVRDVRTRVLTEMAWVTMKTYIDMDTGPFNVTNIFEFHNGRWYMVHHHSSVLNGEVDQQIMHA